MRHGIFPTIYIHAFKQSDNIDKSHMAASWRIHNEILSDISNSAQGEKAVEWQFKDVIYAVIMFIITEILNADLSAGPRRAALMNKFFFEGSWLNPIKANEIWNHVRSYQLEVVNQIILTTAQVPTPAIKAKETVKEVGGAPQFAYLKHIAGDQLNFY